MPKQTEFVVDLYHLLKGTGFDENRFEHVFFKKDVFALNCTDQADTAIRMRQLHARSKALRLSSGLEQLGLAYLFIVLPHGEMLPLFVRACSLEASSEKYNSWTITAGKHLFVPGPTKKLLQKSGANIFLQQLQKWFIQTGKTPWQDLLLLLSAETSWPLEEGALHPKPEQPEEELPSACIIRSGLFGFFPPPTEAEHPKEEKTITLPQPAKQLQSRIDFELLAPPDSSILEASLEKPETRIKLNSSQTASRLAFQLLGRLLSNGQSVLVISDQSAPLQRLQRDMQKKQIDQLGFLLRRPEEDEHTLYQLLQAFAKSSPAGKYQPERKRALENKIRQSSEALKQSALRHQLLRKPQSDGLCYEEWTGLFLHYRKQCGPEILNSIAAIKELEFSAEEGENLSRQLKKAERLFQKVRRARHPLSELHPEFFTDMAEPAARQSLEQRLDAFAERLHEIHHRLIQIQAQYRLEIRQQLEDNYLHAQNRIQEIQRDIQQGENLFGSSFKNNGLSMLKLKAKISKKQTHTLKAREQLLQKYQSCKETLENIDQLKIILPEASVSLLPSQMTKALETAENQLKDWRTAQRQEMNEHLLRLSAKTAWEEIPSSSEISKLESDFDQLIEELNNSQIYHAHIENRVLTLIKRQQLLEQLLEQFENTRQHLSEFPQVYKWQHFLLKLPGKSRKLILALARINPMNWHAAFLSWHYERLLTRYYQPIMRQKLPKAEKENTLTQSLQLQALLPEYIRLLWQEKSHQLDKTKTGKDPNIQKLATQFPVLLLNIFAAAHLFPKLAEVYDYVLLLNYGNLPENWTEIIPAYGLPYSLWEIHPQQKSGPYSAAEKPTYRQPAVKIRDIPASGQPEKDGTNLAEADQLIQLLNQLHPQEGENYPRLAMVAFSEAQRTLINDYLRRLHTQSKNRNFLTELFRKGLATFLPHELPGMEYDLLLVSLGYDKSALQEEKSKDILRQWPSMKEVARKGIYLIHSLDEKHPLIQALCSDEVQQQEEPEEALPCPTLLQELKEAYQKKYGRENVRIRQTANQMGLQIKTESEMPETLLLIDGLLSSSPYPDPLWEWQTQRILEQMGHQLQTLFCTELWMKAEHEAEEIK